MEEAHLESVGRNIDGRLARIEQMLPTLSTKTELQEAVAKLATKTEFEEAVSKLATKDELREEGERTRRHFDVVAERLEDKIALLAEGQTAIHEKMDKRVEEIHSVLANHERRLTVLEGRRRR